MKRLLPESAPPHLRWVIERAKDANHQTTPLAAIPAALMHLFREGQGPLMLRRTSALLT